ncbi:uncharacterized protein [Nicotiana tomentosiformis]|uniref:uncharacterized protein n=1 Tax=Nicotiana tomentosiformis TaxID=4098 RepID=UPI00388CBD9E
MDRKHCARRWWHRAQHHSSTQVGVESVASAMSGPSLFFDSPSMFSPNPSSSRVENTTENVELEGGKSNNIDASSVDRTPYQALPKINSELVIAGVALNDKGKAKVVEDSELGGSRRESVPETETQPINVDCSDGSQVKKKKIGVAPKKIRVMHHLLIREVHHEVKNEMRFVVNDSRLRFGLGEFALVTGLKCKSNTSIESVPENRLISKYFGTASVTLAQLVDCFTKKKWETDDDALKIAVLYFVNNFLLSLLKPKVISWSYIDLVECGNFNNYPWGIDVYNATTDSCSNKFQDKPSFYRLGGFPLALQIWLYECCPSLDGRFVDHIGKKLPRILNWVVKGQIQNERVALRMFSLQREQLKNITPTDAKKQLFDVRDLNFEIEVYCTDSQPDSFQVYGTQLPKTQSMHQSTGGDSEPTNAEVMKELQGLKLFVETKFEELLAAIRRQSMKPKGNLVHKQHDIDPYFGEMHNDYDQFERGGSENDVVVIGDSTPKVPSISDFCGVGREGGSSGVNVKNVTARHGVVIDDLHSAPFVNKHDLGLDSNFELSAYAIDQIIAITQQAKYKQPSHDGTIVDVTNSEVASRVDGVGQANVGGDNVNLPSGNLFVISTPCRHEGDLDLDSDFEYTDSQLDLIVVITQGGRRNVNQSGNKLTTRDVNKSKPDQSLDPCFDFEVEQIDDKMFFHTLNYSGRPLSSSHLNIIFYYLRKKAKYEINIPIKVITTNTLFNNTIQRVYIEFVKGGKQDHLIDRSDDIMEYIKEFWIRNHKKAIQKVAEAYAVLIPLFLVSTEFYNQRSDIVVENGLHLGKDLTDPFEIELITNLPTHQNTDYGVYVASFAEYIIEGLPILVANFDVDGLRARFGILLWHYERNKQLYGESSESEAPVVTKNTREKKRKK